MPAPLTPTTWTVDGWPGGQVDDNGVMWIVDHDEGWWDAPAPRVNHTDRVFGHGSYRGRAFNQSRLITLQGVMSAPVAAAADLAAQQFAAVAADGDLHELVVTDDTLGPMACLVERSGSPKFSRQNRRQATFQLELIAPDPRKHAYAALAAEAGLAQGSAGGLTATAPGVMAAAPGVAAGVFTSSGSVQLTNFGTAPAAPVLELAGPLTTPIVTVAETGVRLVYTSDIPAGVSLFINTDVFPAVDLPPRSVLLGRSSDRRRYLSLPMGWPVIDPGSTATFTLSSPSSDPAARLRVYLRSTWW